MNTHTHTHTHTHTQCTLDDPCPVYPIYRLSVHNRKLLVTND